MITIGIDPGLTGAISVIGNEIELFDMPVMAKPTRGNQVDGAQLAVLLRIQASQDAEVFLEQVGAMPGQGVSSMFNFGHGYGMVQGVLFALRIPFTLVTPQKWKRYHHLIGKQKDMARTLCIQQNPALAGELKRKKDVGRADALLIAKYGQFLQK